MSKINDFYPLILESLNNNKLFSFPINGTSMRPLLNKGDIVTLKKIDKLKKGDIVLFIRNDNSFVLHRIIKINKNNSYNIVGDHQVKIEKNILDKQLIGVVTQYKRKNKAKYNSLNKLSYKIYSLLVRLSFIRFIFSKLY